MKPFNIEAAKRGDRVVTSMGSDARIICFDCHGKDSQLGIIALVTNKNTGEETLMFCDCNGLPESFVNGKLLMWEAEKDHAILYPNGKVSDVMTMNEAKSVAAKWNCAKRHSVDADAKVVKLNPL